MFVDCWLLLLCVCVVVVCSWWLLRVGCCALCVVNCCLRVDWGVSCVTCRLWCDDDCV